MGVEEQKIPYHVMAISELAKTYSAAAFRVEIGHCREVIAKLGMTGNAGAPHTHFGIRPGGRTAPAVNPYPTLVKIC